MLHVSVLEVTSDIDKIEFHRFSIRISLVEA
jgi:hypothetical protein